MIQSIPNTVAFNPIYPFPVNRTGIIEILFNHSRRTRKHAKRRELFFKFKIMKAEENDGHFNIKEIGLDVAIRLEAFEK